MIRPMKNDERATKESVGVCDNRRNHNGKRPPF